MTAVKDTTFNMVRLESLLIQGGSRVFWRHDVDFDVRCAMMMARVEASHEIHSTYYLRVDEDEYPLDFMAATAECIRNYGHRVGIHVDLRLPRDAQVTHNELVAACDEAHQLGASRFPDVEKLVSFHAPPVDALWRPVFGYEHAMAKCWRGSYLADSRGFFRESPEMFLAKEPPVQLNLHPEWWFLPEAEADALRQQEAAKP